MTAVLGAAGDGGNLRIQTGDLTLSAGGTISAQAITLGQGGDIEITADRIEVSGRDNTSLFFPSQISTSTSSESGEPAGNLTINANQLRVLNGGEISVDTLGGNAAGNLSISASDFVEITGEFISDSGEIAPSRISASTSRFGGGSGGNINISTADLIISQGAELTVSSLGEGTAGNLNVNGDSMQILDRGKIVSTQGHFILIKALTC